VPVALATWQGIKADIDAAKAKDKAEPAKAITEQPATPGVAVPDPATFAARG